MNDDSIFITCREIEDVMKGSVAVAETDAVLTSQDIIQKRIGAVGDIGLRRRNRIDVEHVVDLEIGRQPKQRLRVGILQVLQSQQLFHARRRNLRTETLTRSPTVWPFP